MEIVEKKQQVPFRLRIWFDTAQETL